MPRCEDFPCCGHAQGDCPRIDSHGRAHFTCVECGKELPARASSSICVRCQRQMFTRDAYGDSPYGHLED